MLQYRDAAALTKRRGQMTDADIQSVRKAGYTGGQIVAIVAATVFTNLVNRTATRA
jgi:alkylhydroperoxidase family enzyme